MINPNTNSQFCDELDAKATGTQSYWRKDVKMNKDTASVAGVLCGSTHRNKAQPQLVLKG